MEARELEIQRISRSLNLKAVKNARTRHATSARWNKSTQLASQRSRPLRGFPPQGSKLFLRLWRPLLPVRRGLARPRRLSLGLFCRNPLTRNPLAQSDTREVEPPQLEDISSEGELPDSDQSGTPVLEELLMGRDELEDYNSRNFSPVINKTPLWRFTEQTPSGSQAQTRTHMQLLRLNPRLVLRLSLKFLRPRP